MRTARWLRHLAMPGWWVRRHFPGESLRAIEKAVAEAESGHRGELRFAIEGRMPLTCLLRGASPRDRATELFARLGMANTREASGVLIYVQLADRRVEILADRGIAGKVPQTEWDAICRQMEREFAQGRWRAGAVGAVATAGRLLAVHLPAPGANPDELPNRPLVL